MSRKRPSGLWGSLAAISLAAGAFFAYLMSRATGRPPTREEQLAVVIGLIVFASTLTGLAVRSAWKRWVVDFCERLSAMARDPVALGMGKVPGEMRILAEEIEQFANQQREAVDRQKKTVEILQKEQQMAEITLQSLLGKADSEEGQSHSLIHRRSVGDSAVGGSALRDMIARLTPNLTWLAATPAMQKFLGFTIAELNGRSILELIHRDDVPAVKEAFERALKSGEGHSIEFRLLLRGSDHRNVQVDVLTRYTPDGRPLHFRCHFLDITERIRSNTELRVRTDQLLQANEQLRRINRDLERLKESYRDLYHNAPVMYFSLDTQGRLASSNETMLKTLGYTRDDLADQPYATLLTPEYRMRFQQRPDAFQRAGEMETQWIKKDGTVIDIWVRNVPVVDIDGTFLRSRSAAQDVTERNRLGNALRQQAEELQRANEQLRRTNRELDDFTYVVSHDLKEPLRTLQAFSNFLSEDYGDKLGAEGKEFIGHLIAASKRLGILIDDLLTLSRAGRVINTQQLFDFNDTVNQVKGDLANLIQRKNAVVRVEGPLPSVAGDPQRIAQLLTNLISNGLKYNNSPRPEVLIGLRRHPMNPAEANEKPANGEAGPSADAGRVVLYVRDNGIGIEPRYHEQIFGIFRRLHLPEEYEGTGAGLAIAKKIVEAHGGRIWVESQPGKGATFCFTLSPTATASIASRVTQLPGRSTMILADTKA
jgi:PAS domain S-box-containing protein